MVDVAIRAKSLTEGIFMKRGLCGIAVTASGRIIGFKNTQAGREAILKRTLGITNTANIRSGGGGHTVAASVPKQKIRRTKVATKRSSNTQAVVASTDDGGGDPDPEPEQRPSSSPATSHSQAPAIGGIKLIPKITVCTTAGISPAQVYVLIKRDNFPQPVKLGRSSRWIESEVFSWIESKAAARNSCNLGA